MLTRIVVAVTVLWGLVFTSSILAGRWEFKAGVGYDFLSQEFTLDSLQQIGTDSVLVNWSLRRDYLDDLKGLLSVRYLSRDFRTLDARWQYEQTDELIRQKGSFRWQPKAGKLRLDFRQELEHRVRYHGEDEAGDQYLSGFSRIRGRVPVSERIELFGQTDLDFVDFGGAKPISADYQRGLLRAGVYRQGENLSLELAGFGGGRRAPDSVRLEYWQTGVDATAIGQLGSTEHMYMLRLERRDYSRAPDEDDYWRLDLNGRTEGRLRDPYSWQFESDFEMVWFGTEDQLNADYQRAQLALLAGRSLGEFRLATGPTVDLLFEQTDEFGLGEEHREAGGRIDLDYMHPWGLFGSLQWQLAWRNLVDEGELQSDFRVQRLNLIGDLPAGERLRLGLFFSAEWEWHERSEDNLRVYLLSSSLTYKFH